jgi:hypothetical protein
MEQFFMFRRAHVPLIWHNQNKDKVVQKYFAVLLAESLKSLIIQGTM